MDGRETIVRESSTADPTRPVENSVFLPQGLFPSGLTYTWSVTRAPICRGCQCRLRRACNWLMAARDTAGGNPAVYGDPRSLPREQIETHVELAPPVKIPWPSNRRWREDEFMLPRHLTQGRDLIRVRVEFQPAGLPLFPGRAHSILDSPAGSGKVTRLMTTEAGTDISPWPIQHAIKKRVLKTTSLLPCAVGVAMLGMFAVPECKGHRGLSSYPTKDGNQAPGFVGDPLRIWREATIESQRRDPGKARIEAYLGEFHCGG